MGLDDIVLDSGLKLAIMASREIKHFFYINLFYIDYFSIMINYFDQLTFYEVSIIINSF